jgi:TolB protein
MLPKLTGATGRVLSRLLAAGLCLAASGLARPAEARPPAEANADYSLYLPFWVKDGARVGTLTFHSNRDGNYEIYRMNPDGTDLVRLTVDPAFDRAPAFISGKSYIVFESNRFGGNNEIYTMTSAGGSVVRLTNHPANDNSPAWSPDGARIAFVSTRDHALGEIYTMSAADGSNVQRLTSNGVADGQPRWSPDGTQLAYTTGAPAQVWVMNADGSGQHPIADGYAPDWSPDGEQLLYTCTDGGDNDICLVEVAGSVPIVLTQNSAFIDFRPVWSPDGLSMAFVSNRDNAQYEIYVMPVSQNAAATRITNNNVDDGNVDW